MIESIEIGRKEDGNRSIANKIKNRLHDLDKTVENNYGRWIWELLQNAKDSISENADRNISVQLEINSDSIVFKHNGSYFTELDIRGLINQISSKEVEEGTQSKKIGRFGTGFLTTHLLSRKVKISGIVATKSDDFYTFDFVLDRDSNDTNELALKVEQTWKDFQESTQKIESSYDENDFNTTFTYLLKTKAQREIAVRGLKEFANLIPYVFTFIPKIQDIKIVNSGKSFLYQKTTEEIHPRITKIHRSLNGKLSDVLIFNLKNKKVSIAIEVEKIETGYSVKSIENIPKLFCDFPLIGTEKFHFPVVVNSFFFNPQTERDGIWLKGDDDEEVLENKQLIETSFELVRDLVNQVSKEDFFDLYNLAITKTPSTNDKYFDIGWYEEKIQKPLREFLKASKLVETNKGKESIEKVYFPDKDQSNENREKLWQFSYDLKVNALPKKEHIQKWANVIWADCKKVNIDDIVADLKDKKNISELADTLELKVNQVYEWLNEYLKFVYENSSSLTFHNYEIIPNQNGDFKTCKNIYLDEIEDETLKEIAQLLDYNYYEELVHRDILTSEQCTKAITLDDIARKITSLLDSETDNDNRKMAITMLIEWFDNNEERSKEYFSTLYRKKEKLLVDTIEDKQSLYSILNSKVDISEVANLVKQAKKNPDKIMESIDKAKALDELLQEYGASNIDELKGLILSNTSIDPKDNQSLNDTLQTEPRKEITQEILASLGVTTLEELTEVLKDEKISQQFYHTSTPTVEMFQYAQIKIERAKKNIIEFLKNHKDYDCSDYEELAPTVIGGIKKFGRSQPIVVRPSDNKQVIIYYDSEKDILDYESAELWIEDGRNDPKRLTLGKVLKSTGITRIPV